MWFVNLDSLPCPARPITLTAKIDINRLAQILRAAADVEIMPRFRALGAEDVREKSSATDLVTEADEAAECFIKAECGKLWPEATFIGEESVAANPALLDGLGKTDLAIVVDPIDGTANFAAGMPLFAVMASVVAKGETVAGILYDPLGTKDFLHFKFITYYSCTTYLVAGLQCSCCK